jgi:TolB protein
MTRSARLRLPPRALLARLVGPIVALASLAVVWAQPAVPVDPAGLIAFVDPDGRLALVDPTTGDVRAASPIGARAGFPLWSSDGNRVATIVADQAGVRVDVVDVAGGGATTTVHRAAGRSPIYLDWAPDDRTLAVLVGLPGGGLALDLVDPSAEAGADPPRTLAEGAPFYWDWSRTGRSLLVHVNVGSPNALAGLTPAAGFDVARPLPEPAGFQSPALSSDDRLVAYARRDPSGRSVVVVGNPDRPDAIIEPRVLGFRGTAAVAWRPGAAQLAIQRSEAPSAQPHGPVDLLDVVSGDVRRLSDDLVLASFWSPDGRYLATLSLVGGGGDRTVATTSAPSGSAAPSGAAAQLLRVQAPGTALALKALEVDTGAVRPLGVFTPSPLFLLQYLPFFDQYARSHRLWSPASDALVLPALDDDGVPTLVRFGIDGEARPLVAGDLPAWNVR